jgi:hypothetical protein
VGSRVKLALKLGIGTGPVLPDGASSLHIQSVDHPRKAATLEASPVIGLVMTTPVGVYRHGSGKLWYRR